jgi:ribosomal-protein-alanine N-acetyltransferase
VIEQVCFADPWSLRDFRQALEWGATFLVATSGEDVAGYVVARRAADEGEILNLAVAPGHRGHGVGQELVTRVLTSLAELGAGAAYLEVRESNAVARRRYQRVGFREVGRRVGYYRRPREDAVLLRTAIVAVQGDAKQ